jgi:hypothetical protein
VTTKNAAFWDDTLCDATSQKKAFFEYFVLSFKAFVSKFLAYNQGSLCKSVDIFMTVEIKIVLKKDP